MREFGAVFLERVAQMQQAQQKIEAEVGEIRRAVRGLTVSEIMAMEQAAEIREYQRSILASDSQRTLFELSRNIRSFDDEEDGTP